MSFLDRVREGAAAGRSITIVGTGGRASTATHAALLAAADDAATGLAARGAEPGERVGVVMATSLDAITSLLAVWAVGATPVLLTPRGRLETRERWAADASAMLRRCRASVVIAPRATAIPSCEVVELGDLRGRGASTSGGAGSDAALITFSSGTTASRKPIVRGHRGFVALADAHRDVEVVGDGSDHRLGWSALVGRGLTSDVLYPMAWGIDSTILAPQLFAASPIRWLTEISERRATQSSAATFAYRMVTGALEAGAPAGLDLSCWRVARCGGEAIDPDVLHRFTTVASRHGFDPGAICTTYGLTETGSVAAHHPGDGITVDDVDRDALLQGHAAPASPGSPARAITSSGRLTRGVRLRVRGPEGREVGPRRVGALVVSTPWAMLGVLDDDGTLVDEHVDGWFDTGDIGYFADGHIHVVGRAKDVIIVRGRNLLAVDIERAAAVGGVESGGCAAVAIPGDGTERIALVVEHASFDDSVRERVTRAVGAEIGVVPAMVIAVEPGDLPRTADGKLKRAAVRALVLASIDGAQP